MADLTLPVSGTSATRWQLGGWGGAVGAPNADQQFQRWGNGAFQAEPLLRAGSVTGLILLFVAAPPIGDTVTVALWQNGVKVPACSLVANGDGAAKTFSATFAAGTYPFAVGDNLEIRYSTVAWAGAVGLTGSGIEITQ